MAVKKIAKTKRKYIAANVPSPIVAALDRLISRGVFRNRSHAVEAAILAALGVHTSKTPHA